MQNQAKGIDQSEDEGNDKRNLSNKFYRKLRKMSFFKVLNYGLHLTLYITGTRLLVQEYLTDKARYK